MDAARDFVLEHNLTEDYRTAILYQACDVVDAPGWRLPSRSFL